MRSQFLFSPEKSQGGGNSCAFGFCAGGLNFFLTTGVPGDILKMNFKIIYLLWKNFRKPNFTNS